MFLLFMYIKNEKEIKSKLSAFAFIQSIKEFVLSKFWQAGAKPVFIERTSKNTNKK